MAPVPSSTASNGAQDGSHVAGQKSPAEADEWGALLVDHADEPDALPPELKYSNFDLFCTLVSIVTYIFDLSMDIIVAVYFYHLGISHGIYHYWYFGLTVAFILLPSLTMTGFSFRWYLMDADNSQLPPVPLWLWTFRLAMLMLQIAPILRYFDSMRNGLYSRWAGHQERTATTNADKAEARSKRVGYYTMMVYEDADATLLRLFECFMESAPQLVLQIYILIKDPHAVQITDDSVHITGDTAFDPILKKSVLIVSIVASLISLAWSLVVYHRSLRYTFPDKKNINKAGSFFQFVWHFASITARVLALSLFASAYPVWILPVCAAHWLVMTAWAVFQCTQACDTKCEEILFCLVLGAVYIFSFFNAKDERTRYKYLIYYGFCFLENTALIIIWFVQLSWSTPGPLPWYAIPGLVGHYVAFFAGILFMCIYYSFFHPADIDASWVTGAVRRFLRAGARRQEPKSVVIDLREHTTADGVRDASLPSSHSLPRMDSGDSPDAAVAVRAARPILRKTSSAPASSVAIAKRTLKSMGKVADS